jgi:hypothetical protein
MPHYVISAALMIVVVVYLGLVVGLMSYLRRAHPNVWIALGRPGIPDQAEHARNPWPFVESAYRTMVFIFSNRHQELRDRRLTHLIWLIRMALAADVVFFAAAISLKP